MEKKHILIAAGSAAVVLVIGTIFFVRNQAVAKAGDYFIYRKDVSNQKKIFDLQFEGAQAPDPKQSLIQTYTRAQVLKDNGFPITDEIMKTEEQLISRATKPGSPFEKVVRLFKNDPEGYRRTFLMPIVTERVLSREIFQKAPELEEAKKKAAEFAAAYRKNPKNVKSLAEAAKGKIDYGTLTKKEGLLWDGDADRRKKAAPMPKIPSPFAQIPEKIFEKEWNWWTKQTLGGLKEGEVRPQPVEFGQTWLCVKLISHKTKPEEVYRLEAVKLPKANPYEWYAAQAKKVKVEIY